MTGSTQFYKLTLDRAIADYRDGLITATGLLRYYLKIRYAKGWKIRLNPEEICSLLGFTKATFYKALAKLKKLGRAEIGKLNLIPLTLTEESEAEEKQDSPTVDTQSPTVYSESPTEEKESPTVKSSLQLENFTPPKPPKTKASSSSPDFYSNNSNKKTDTLSQSTEVEEEINQLTSEERENFRNFCEKQAYQLPTTPTLINRWIMAHLGELWGLWLKSRAVVQNTTSTVDFQKWYDMMKEMGHVRSHRQDEQGNRLVQDNCGYWLPWEKYLKSWTIEKVQKAYKRSSQR